MQYAKLIAQCCAALPVYIPVKRLHFRVDSSSILDKNENKRFQFMEINSFLCIFLDMIILPSCVAAS